MPYAPYPYRPPYGAGYHPATAYNRPAHYGNTNINVNNNYYNRATNNARAVNRNNTRNRDQHQRRPRSHGLRGRAESGRRGREFERISRRRERAQRREPTRGLERIPRRRECRATMRLSARVRTNIAATRARATMQINAPGLERISRCAGPGRRNERVSRRRSRPGVAVISAPATWHATTPNGRRRTPPAPVRTRRVPIGDSTPAAPARRHATIQLPRPPLVRILHLRPVRYRTCHRGSKERAASQRGHQSAGRSAPKGGGGGRRR